MTTKKKDIFEIYSKVAQTVPVSEVIFDHLQWNTCNLD